LPACAVGAPHRRDRVWFVAYNAAYSNSRRLERSEEVGRNSINAEWKSEFGITTNSDGIRQHECERDNEEFTSERGINAFNDITKNVEHGAAAYTKNIGSEYALENRELEGGRFRQSNKRGFWNTFPSQSPICGGDDGLPTELDGITFPKWRAESIKAYGNAIVPQVAYEIFKVIEQLHYDKIPR